MAEERIKVRNKKIDEELFEKWRKEKNYPHGQQVRNLITMMR